MSRKKGMVVYSAAFLLTAVAMIVLCVLKGIVPFGAENSMAIMDAQIQYLDFFAYFKDVLSGTQKIGYSFTRSLGGGNIAVFSYYLASPFNLLVAFFEKDHLQSFFTIAVILKLATSSLTCSVFLKNRFRELENVVILVLSIGYGMMEYNIDQASNIMWLDGVYMLPLILLGVSQLVHERKHALLMGAAGLALLFNWYAAAIDFLFSVIWLLYEMLLKTPWHKSNIRKYVSDVLHYSMAMIVALLVGAALFLPSIMAMSDGKGGIEWAPAIGCYGLGNIFSVLQRLTIGSKSEYGNISLYCGSLAVIGCVLCLIGKGQNKWKKGLQIVFLALTISFFYIPVFIWGFSLLKWVGSYWYRYGYIGVLALIAVAADVLEDKESFGRALWQAGALAVLTLFFFEYTNSQGKLFYVYMTALAFLVTILCLQGNFFFQKKVLKCITAGLLLVTALAELTYNAYVILSLDSGVDSYRSYSGQESALLRELQEQDAGYYRIHASRTRGMGDSHTTANYNEGLAYNYPSISSYTSDPEVQQLEFLDHIGYRYNVEGSIAVTNDAVLGADSLLGVKYILTSDPVLGCEKVEGIGTYNGKSVYYNPYVLPMAFTYAFSGTQLNEGEQNAMLYQNQFYSCLAARNVEINKKLDVESQIEGNSAAYIISHQDNPVYGWFDMKDGSQFGIYTDEQMVTWYNGWPSPKVVYIPQKEGAESTRVRMDGENVEEHIAGATFYYTDLEALERVTEEIQSRAENDLTISDGCVSGIIKNSQNLDRLYLSIPYDRGWTIKINGKKIKPELIGGCMMSLPIEAGENAIEMRYRVPGWRLGVFLSVFGIGGCLAVAGYEIRRNKNEGIKEV